MARAITVTVYGSWSCDPSVAPSMFGVELNDIVLFVGEVDSTTTRCECDTCDPAKMLTTEFRNGIPSYLPSVNYLRIRPYRNSLCVNRVDVVIEYNPVQTTELPTAFMPIPFSPISQNQTDCPICNSGLVKDGVSTFCSSSSTTSVQVAVYDPVPAGAVLVALDVYFSFNFVSRPYGSSYPTRLSVKLVGTEAVNGIVSDVGWRNTKCGCLGNGVLYSPFFQRGWPNYVYDAENVLTIQVIRGYSTYGDLCLGRLYASYVYYYLSDESRTLHRLEQPIDV